MSVEYLNCDNTAEFAVFTNRLASTRRNEPVVIQKMLEECENLAAESQPNQASSSPDCPDRLVVSAANFNDNASCCNCFSPTEDVVCDACVAGKSACAFLPRISSLKDILRIGEVEESCWASYGSTASFCCCTQQANVSQVGLVKSFASVLAPASTTPGKISFISC